MKFAIMVNAGPYRSCGAHSAYLFTAAALDRGHEVVRVFFYGDGVYNAQRFGRPPADEPDLTALWSKLARDRGIDLVLCGAAAERRGVLGSEGEIDDAWPGVAEGFRVAGLGLWVEACLAAERTLVFHG